MRRAFPFPGYSPIYALRRLNILSRFKDSLRISFFTLFRAGPCLRLLEGLEKDLRQKVRRMTVGFLTPKIEKIKKHLTHTAGSPRDPPCDRKRLHPNSMHVNTRLHQPMISRVLARKETTSEHARWMQLANALSPRPTTPLPELKS